MAGIIWLASYPKSGNTWLRAFLANYLADLEQPVPINELKNFVFGDNAAAHFETLLGHKISDHYAPELDPLRAKVHHWIAQTSHLNVFVKTHNRIAAVRGYPLITPSATAGAVYVVRNPLDVAVSFAHHFKGTIDRAVELLCDSNATLQGNDEHMNQYIGSWKEHIDSWLGAPGLRCHVMRYEDMMARPHETFAGLIGFLGQPADQTKLQKAIDFSSFSELKKQEGQDGFNESHPDGDRAFFRSGKIGDWTNTLESSQIERLIEFNGEFMKKFGYLDEDDQPITDGLMR